MDSNVFKRATELHHEMNRNMATIASYENVVQLILEENEHEETFSIGDIHIQVWVDNKNRDYELTEEQKEFIEALRGLMAKARIRYESAKEGFDAL